MKVKFIDKETKNKIAEVDVKTKAAIKFAKIGNNNIIAYEKGEKTFIAGSFCSAIYGSDEHIYCVDRAIFGKDKLAARDIGECINFLEFMIFLFPNEEYFKLIKLVFELDKYYLENMLIINGLKGPFEYL
ncbi:MAG: hypothetical protein QXS91_02730 [Candidatus Anstonellales archaeon]